MKKCRVTCLQYKFTEEGKCLPLPSSCFDSLAGKTREKKAGHRTSTGWRDHVSSSWSLLFLDRVWVHMTFMRFEPHLLVKFPSISVGESSKVFNSRIMYFVAEKSCVFLKLDNTSVPLLLIWDYKDGILHSRPFFFVLSFAKYSTCIFLVTGTEKKINTLEKKARKSEK